MMDDLGTWGAGPCRDCGQPFPGRWPGERCRPCWDLRLDQRRQAVDDGPTALYRLYDADRHLLYIGITTDTRRRFKEHAKTMPWWPEVADQRVEWHNLGGSTAQRLESVTIRAELPLYNKTGYLGKGRPTAHLPPGCPPQPWLLDYPDAASYRAAWTEWRARLEACRRATRPPSS